jgi:hypothetical protein
MLNGGGFVSGGGGTDYSQQTTAQYTFTDLSSSTGTSTTPAVLSVSHSFVAADVGNIIHITAGTSWTAGWYQIVSVATGAATLDRACGSVATLTSGTYYVGGALSFGSTQDSNFCATTGVVGGNIVWVRNTTTPLTLGIAVSTRVATTALPIKFIGYNATRGDNPSTVATMPAWNQGAFGWTLGQNTNFSYINFTGTPSNIFTCNAANNIFNTCKIVNTNVNTGVTGISSTAGGIVALNCEISALHGIGFAMGGTIPGCQVNGCYIHNCQTGISIVTTGAGNVVANSIIEGCTTAAIALGSGALLNTIMNNTFYGAEVPNGAGIATTNGNEYNFLFNNIFYGLTTALTENTTASTMVANYNNYFNNTTNYTGISAGANDKALQPGFVGVTNLTGTTATTLTGNIISDSSQNFSNVVNNQDTILIKSGTGVVTGYYLITSHTTTTVTVTPAITANATADKAYELTLGHNFNVAIAMQGLAFPQTLPGGFTTSYGDLGGSQRNPTADYTDPGVANVQIGTTYLYATVLETGTYTGANRWSDPGVANVISPTTYNANAVGKTGTYVGPTTSTVEVGTTYGASSGLTGTYNGSNLWSDPGVANVLSTVSYQVNSATANETGTYVSPATSIVETGSTYGPSSGLTGIYTGANRWSDPGAMNVRSGTVYQANSLTNNEIGSYLPVALPQVLNCGLGLDSSYNLNGAFWATSNSAIITSGLGTASYAILKPDGTSAGVSQSSISAAGSGLFFITPVSVTSLIGTSNYLIEITIVVNSVSYTQYFEFPIQTAVPTNPLLTTDTRLNDLDAAISSRLATSGYTAPANSSIATILTDVAAIPTNPLLTTDTRLNNLDAAVSSRLATSGYTAPANASIATILTDVAAIPTTPLLAANYTAPNNASIAAIKLQTDQLGFTGGNVNANAQVVSDKTGYDLASGQFFVKKNVAFANFGFPMYDSTLHQPITGLTPTVQISIDGGAFANSTNAASEVGSGLYKISFVQAEMNGTTINLKFSATGADTIFAEIITQP